MIRYGQIGGAPPVKLTVTKSSEMKEPAIIIRCSEIDTTLRNIINYINLQSRVITTKQDGVLYRIPLVNVFFFESVNNKTYLHTDNDVILCSQKLYELEKELEHTSFLRISKSQILNLDYVQKVKTFFNGKYEATLTNDETIIISRHYVGQFKEKMES